MVKPAHTKVTFSGVFGPAAAPLEQWQWGVNFGEGAMTPATRLALATAARDAWVTSLKGSTHADVRLTRVRVSQHAAGGLVGRNADGAFDQADLNVDEPGLVSGGVRYPYQTALTVSLMTDRPGPEGRGRFYLPGFALALGTDGRLTVGDADSMATKARAVLVQINAAYDTNALPNSKAVVVSSKGFSTVVRRVRVGRVLDTQRRRRGDLVEGYVVSQVL